MDSHLSLFKPSRSAFYYIQFVNEYGRRQQRSTRCKNKRDALEALADLKNLIKEKLKPINFSVFAERYKISIVGAIAESSIVICGYSFNHFLRLMGDIPLNKITAQHWDTFRALRMKEVRPVTVNIELRTLKSAFSTAVRWKLLEENPFKMQSMCLIADQDAPFLTTNQFKSVRIAIQDANAYDVVNIAFHTGMRSGEIVSLKWSNINLVTGDIYVKNSPNFKTKTGKQRTIPMNSEVMTILKRRDERRTGEGDEIFPGVRGQFVSKQFKAAVRLVLGKNSPIHFHSLRHSFCSNLVSAGANIRVIQILAGHSCISTTEKYLHHITSDARNAVELLSMN